MVDGLLIVVGGTLLLAPGFITDIFGLILLIPPTRAIVRSVLKRFTIGRFVVVGMPGGDRRTGGGRRRPSRDYDFDATAEEVPVNGRARRAPATEGRRRDALVIPEMTKRLLVVHA